MITRILSVLLLFCSFAAYSQQPSRSELEKQKAAIQKEMDDVRRSLDETKRNRKASMAQLNAVQRKLQLREREINVINQQINLIEGDINQGWRDITKLKKELDTLKEQYSKSVVYSYKTGATDFLNFIFSANSFNDAIKRVAYLKSYRAYREEQASNIVRTQDQIQNKIASLNQSRTQKSIALKEEDKAKDKLEDEKEKDEVVGKLKAREKELTKEFDDKRRQDLKLSNAIAAAIKRARDAAIAEAKKNAEIAAKSNAAAAAANKANNATNATNNNTAAAAPKKEAYRTFDDDASRLSTADFEKNRGRLPWPIESGRISMRFGPQLIPGTHVSTNNQFLTFETDAGKTVKAIFDGEVVMVTYVGDVQAVIIRHGRYFTSYSNLSSVSVSKGQQVKTGQALGKVAEKEDNVGELDLGITNDANKNFDPEKWLR